MRDYREPEGLTDSVLLDRLQDHPEDMTEDEHAAFLDMASRNPRSRHPMSRRQREWAEAVYRSGDLQRHYVANLASKASKAGDAPKHPIDSVIASRPLTPPGRM